MELSQIRYFIAVSETLNFTRAAERCFISQPALTKGIKKLEGTLGGVLIHRSKNMVELSQLGKTLLPNFQKIYVNAQQTREEAERLLREQSALVRLGLMSTMPLDIILPAIDMYISHQHTIDIRLFEGTFDEIAKKLTKHELDLAILSAPPLSSQRIQGDTLFRERFVIAHGVQHPFAKLSEVSIRQLNNLNYCNRSGCEYSEYINKILDAEGVHLNVVQHSANEIWVETLIRDNHGITYLPISQALRSGLSYVTTSDHPFVREIKVAVPNKETVDKHTQVLIDKLRAFPWPSILDL